MTSCLAGKLHEFNMTVSQELQVDAAALDTLEQVLNGKASDAQLTTLKKLLEWPSGQFISLCLFSSKCF